MNNDYRGKYKLEHNTYFKVKRLIKSYPELLAKYEEILYGQPSNDGQPRGGFISDITSVKASKLMEISYKIDAIDRGKRRLPKYYQDQIFNYVVYGKPVDIFVCQSTARRWQYRFVYYVWEILHERGQI